jgi:glycosyltransferase involved in cell wall biosynthesis
MRILIPERAHVGHYYTYVRYLIEALRSIDIEIVLAVTPEGLRSAEFQTHLSAVVQGVDVRPILRVEPMGYASQVVYTIANLRGVIEDIRPDSIYVPTADGIAQSVGLAQMVGMSPIHRRGHSECLINRLSFTYPQYGSSWKTIALSLAALRNSPWSTIHVTDVLAYEWIRLHDRPLARRLRLIPDPVERFEPVSREQARRALGICESGRYFVCAGVIDFRKGISTLVKAFRCADLAPADRLLLAGPVSREALALLEAEEYATLRRSGRLVVIDRVLSSTDFFHAVAAADVVCCTYPRQPHPVSVAVKALAYGRPVLGADHFWIGKMVSAFGMGWTVAVDNDAAMAGILPRCLDESAAWKRTEACRRLVEFSSVEDFRGCWVRSLRKRLGMAAQTDLHGWEWVAAALPRAVLR